MVQLNQSPLTRPSNSSPEEAAVQEVKYRRVEEMHEQNLTDGWGSYYPTGRTCHLLPVARLPLPLVSFYGGDYGPDAWTSSAPKVPYQRMCTDARYIQDMMKPSM